MKKIAIIAAVIGVLFTQSQFASQMVKIQALDQLDTQEYIELSLDNPAISNSQTLQNMISDTGLYDDKIIPINASSEMFSLYQQFMNEEIDLKAVVSQDMSQERFFQIYNVFDYFDVTSPYWDQFLEVFMSKFIEYADIYLAEKNDDTDYSSEEQTMMTNYQIFIRRNYSRSLTEQNSFTRIFKKALFTSNDINSLPESNVWNFIVREFGSAGVTITLNEFNDYYPNLYSEIMISREAEMVEMELQDYPFLLIFDSNYDSIEMIIFSNSITQEPFNFYSIEDRIATLLKSLVNKEKVDTLYLSEINLQYIPETIKDLVNLEDLYLQKNALQELPEWILELKSLKNLDLTENQFDVNTEVFMQIIEQLRNRGVLVVYSQQLFETSSTEPSFDDYYSDDYYSDDSGMDSFDDMDFDDNQSVDF